MEYIKMQDIYGCILLKDNSSTDVESRNRLLRKKFDFIMKKILFCKKDDFKVGGHYQIPIFDAPIVKNLLVESLNEESIVCDWFNENLDLENPLNVFLLYNILKPLIMKPEIQGISDDVTTDEWLATIRTVIDYENSKKTLEMHKLLAHMRKSALAQSHQINLGEIVVSDEFGNRKLAISSRNLMKEKIDDIVDSLLNTVTSSDQYYDLINHLLNKFIEKINLQACTDLEFFAEIKKNFDLTSARDLITQLYPQPRMASEYIAFYNNIYKYLKNNNDILDSIEEKIGVKDLLNFFDMSK